MKEAKKDLFAFALEKGVDAICITTNGHYTPKGEGFMGGGSAGVCARRWPKTCSNLGSNLKIHGGVNIPYLIGALDIDGEYFEPSDYQLKSGNYKCLIFSFPTIDDLIDGSKLPLIKQSSVIMSIYANLYNLNCIVMGRPGVGIGNLLWKDVKAVIEPMLDDRFTIVSFDHEE